MLPLNYSPVASSCEFNYTAWLLAILHISSKVDLPLMAIAPHFYEKKYAFGKIWVESQAANEGLIGVLH